MARRISLPPLAAFAGTLSLGVGIVDQFGGFGPLFEVRGPVLGGPLLGFLLLGGSALLALALLDLRHEARFFKS